MYHYSNAVPKCAIAKKLFFDSEYKIILNIKKGEMQIFINEKAGLESLEVKLGEKFHFFILCFISHAD